MRVVGKSVVVDGRLLVVRIGAFWNAYISDEGNRHRIASTGIFRLMEVDILGHVLV